MAQVTVRGRHCAGCVWENKGEVFIPWDGSGANGVLLLGDSGWTAEAQTKRNVDSAVVGTPFSGASGWFIERNLKRLGMRRQDFLIANSYWCKAPALGLTDRQTPEAALAQQHCLPYLDELIQTMKPRAIVAQGNVALRRITGESGIQAHHGYVMKSPQGMPVIPAYHPSFIIQGNQKLAGLWCYAVSRALEMASSPVTVLQDRDDLDLLLDPAPQELKRHIAQYATDWVVCDIETAGGEELEDQPGEDEDEAEVKSKVGLSSWQITRIGFSLNLHAAFSVPWIEPYISICKELYQTSPRVVFWNAAFDTSRLRKVGWGSPRQTLDGMWLWHWHESDLPKALGFVAPLQIPLRPWKQLNSQNPALYNAYDCLIERILWEKLEAAVQDAGRLGSFHAHCTRMVPRLSAMSEHGVLIDRQAQCDFRGRLERECADLDREIQNRIPPQARKSKIWRRQPKLSKAYPNLEGLRQDERGWVLDLPFNPASSQQVLGLIRAFGLHVPTLNGNPTTAAKKLRVLGRKQRVFDLIRQWRERNKLITAYMWDLDQTGRVHPEFGFHPSTWRKSCRNPNMQTIPKRNELAQAFRKMIVAAPGYLLVEGDSSAIEAVLVGYYAQSPAYIELAKRGVHKWLAEQYAGRPVSKSEPLYDKIKRVVHLSNYLGTPQRIADEYPDDFASVGEAKELQDFYFSTPAGQDIRRWQQATILEAAGTGHMLTTPFGHQHRFYNVLGADGRLGDDAKRAVAFRPQASASAIQDIYLDAIESKDRWMMPFFMLLVHDSFIAEVPEEQGVLFAQTLLRHMQMPIEELGGLAIGAEVKVGPNLQEMRSIQ